MANKILWKIYIIWFLRRIVPLMLVQIAALVIVLKVLADRIFFGKIIENAALASGSSYWEFFKYLVNAFLQTNIFVQIIILFVLGVGALLMRDLGRVAINYLKTFSRYR
jgi:hypothetical protein